MATVCAQSAAVLPYSYCEALTNRAVTRRRYLLRLIPLARALAPDRPFFGLQSPGLDDGEPIPRTLEELAGIFLAEMRRGWDAGPYLLCGMSFGGRVAFEMARQAAAAGREPGLVALFDSDLSEILPGLRPAGLVGIERLRGNLRRFLGDRWGNREFVRRTGCRLEIAPTPGDHLTMLEPPHVEALAAELRRRVELQRSSGPP